MWSRNASGLSFPADSAITVGGSSSVQLLVLQVHYIDNSNIDTVNGDSSGVLVQYHSRFARKIQSNRLNSNFTCSSYQTPNPEITNNSD